MIASPVTQRRSVTQPPPAQYGAVLIVDSEEEFYPEEVAKLAADVAERGLGLVVFAEWFNLEVQSQMRFFDDNTRSWWIPVTGGVPLISTTSLLALDKSPF